MTLYVEHICKEMIKGWEELNNLTKTKDVCETLIPLSWRPL